MSQSIQQAVMKRLKFSKRTRRDMYHVLVPVVIASAMAPQALTGSAVFLMTWVLIRMFSNA